MYALHERPEGDSRTFFGGPVAPASDQGQNQDSDDVDSPGVESPEDSEAAMSLSKREFSGGDFVDTLAQRRQDFFECCGRLVLGLVGGQQAY